MKLLSIALGVVAILLGAGLIMPALAKVRDLGVMPKAVLTPYSVGVALVVVGLCVSVFAFTRRKTS